MEDTSGLLAYLVVGEEGTGSGFFITIGAAVPFNDVGKSHSVGLSAEIGATWGSFGSNAF